MGRLGRWLFAALYDRVNAPLERRVLTPLRGQLLRNVSGRVLDLGAGTGANLPFLAAAERIVAAEPDPAMRRRLSTEVDRTDLHVQVSGAAGESLPFSDGSFDWVLCTCVLCSVSDPARVLAETRRVLTPDGRLVIIEHVRGSGLLARWQDVVTPLWSLLAGGCHPNRPIAPLARQAGFSFPELDTYDAFPTVVPARPLIAGVGVACPHAPRPCLDEVGDGHVHQASRRRISSSWAAQPMDVRHRMLGGNFTPICSWSTTGCPRWTA